MPSGRWRPVLEQPLDELLVFRVAGGGEERQLPGGKLGVLGQGGLCRLAS
jgi:hypothetical protein